MLTNARCSGTRSSVRAGRARTNNSRSASESIPFHFGLDTEKGFPHEGHLVFADNKYTEGTGTILVRGVAKNPDGRLIPGSRVRVRVPVSDKYSATLVPDTAVNTDQDQKYLLVVGEGNVVKRRNVRLGRLLDDGMRVVLEPELKANEWIIVEGMELARLNYPVEPVPESARRPPHPPSSPSAAFPVRSQRATPRTILGTLSMLSNFFIDRPIFATVLSIVIVILGGGHVPPVADCPVPGGCASRRPGVCHLSWGKRQDGGRDRGHAHRAGNQRRRADALHVVPLHQRRPDVSRRHVRGGHQPGHGAGAGAEPRVDRASQTAGGSQTARRDHQEEVAGDPAVRQLDFARRELRPALPEQFRVDDRQGRSGPPQGRRRREPSSARATTACGFGSTRTSWRTAE